MLWQRQTYGALDFLGDLGGLFDALKLLCEAFVGPFASFALRVALMASFFAPYNGESNDGKSHLEFKALKIDEDPSKLHRRSSRWRKVIKKRSCLGLYLIGCFYKRNKSRRYREMLEESTKHLNY